MYAAHANASYNGANTEIKMRQVLQLIELSIKGASSVRLKNFDLIGAICLAAINVGWAWLPSRPLAIGIILALPLVLVLPGYTLAQILLHGQKSSEPSSELILRPSFKLGQPVSVVDHIILSFGLSMALDVLLGFVLNVFPFGLQAQSWMISLGLLTAIFALFAAFRRRKGPMNNGRIPGPRITIYQSILFGLALLIAAAAVWLSVIRPPATRADFTQFWMLQSTQTNNSCTVDIGVQSYEAASVTYRIVVKVNSVQVNSWPSVALAPQEKWEQSVAISPGAAASMYVEAQLYRADKPENIYRDAHMTMHSVRVSKHGQELQCTS